MKNNYYLNLNSSPLQSRKLNNRLKKNILNLKMDHSFQCTIDQIYCDNPHASTSTSSLQKPKKAPFPSNILSEKHISTKRVEEFPIPSIDTCTVCSEALLPGEIIYYCLCEKFYHPNCLIKLFPNYMNVPCKECESTYTSGYYKLKTPISSLNKGDTTPNGKTQLGEQNSCSTCDKTMISMDTNINKLENYDKICDLAKTVNAESIVEMIKYDNSMTILNSSSKKENNVSNANTANLNRIALSPINNINTPYSGKSKLISSTSNDIFKYGRHESTTPHCKFEATPDTSYNKIRQHLTLCSNSNKVNNKKLNVSLNSIFEGQNSSASIALNNTTNMSFRNLLFNDIDEENANMTSEDDDDKENCPPLPKESSKYTNDESSEELVDINIEGGISHIISDENKIVDMPMTVDVSINKDIAVNYAKDTLLIFNTMSLNLSTILQILKVAYDKMSDNDRVFSNIFKESKWLTKEEIFRMLSSENFASHFQATSTLSYIDIAKLVLYGIDLSFEFHSNLFTIMFINDIDEIVDVDYTASIKEIVTKLQETKINLIKSFTINAILLDDLTKRKNEKNVKFISFMHEMTMICMGYFYAPKNANELMKAVSLFYTTMDQTAMMNVKLVIKGNKDPSIIIDAMNYPVNKISHNNFEVYIGSMMKKEKKIINFTAKIILNNNSFAINLPLMEVSCEYLIQKNLIGSIDRNIMTSSSLIRNRTNFYAISLPIITAKKEVCISNAVFLRNIAAKTISDVNDAVALMKENKFEDAFNILNETKMNFDLMIKNNTSLFNYLQNTSIDCDVNSNVSKILSYVMMIFNDINTLSDAARTRNYNAICFVLSIAEALSFYRSVVLDDDRFIDDNFN